MQEIEYLVFLTAVSILWSQCLALTGAQMDATIKSDP